MCIKTSKERREKAMSVLKMEVFFKCEFTLQNKVFRVFVSKEYVDHEAQC